MPQCQPAAPQSPCPSARPSCRADSLSTVGGLSGCPHAWTSAASGGAARSCSHWGCWRRTLRGCWSGPCWRRLLAVWRQGLCLGQDAYGIRVPTEVERDHAPGPWWQRCCSDPAAVAGERCAGDWLLLHSSMLPWWARPGEWSPSHAGQSLCPLRGSKYPPRGALPCNDSPLFSGLTGGSIGECLRKVLIGKQGVA